MTHLSRAGAAVLASTAALGVPAVASAAPHGPRFDRDVPARVAVKLRAAERALDRAQERADDGDTAMAVAQLSAVRRNLASALKSAQKRIAAGSDSAEPSAAAVIQVEDDVIDGTVAILDGAGEDVSNATLTTLGAALDGRDALVAAIAALADEDRADYADDLDEVVSDATDEADAITESISDDTLTDAAKTALGNAVTQLGASATAAQAAIVDGADTTDIADEDGPGPGGAPRDGGPRNGGRRGDCPDRPAQQAPPGQQSGTYPGASPAAGTAA